MSEKHPMCQKLYFTRGKHMGIEKIINSQFSIYFPQGIDYHVLFDKLNLRAIIQRYHPICLNQE